MVKNPPANAGDVGDSGLTPGWEMISWIRKWQPIPGFLPGKFYGRRSLAGYCPRGCKELDTTQRPSTQNFIISGVWGERQHTRPLCWLP